MPEEGRAGRVQHGIETALFGMGGRGGGIGAGGRPLQESDSYASGVSLVCFSWRVIRLTSFAHRCSSFPRRPTRASDQECSSTCGACSSFGKIKPSSSPKTPSTSTRLALYRRSAGNLPLAERRLTISLRLVAARELGPQHATHVGSSSPDSGAASRPRTPRSRLWRRRQGRIPLSHLRHFHILRSPSTPSTPFLRISQHDEPSSSPGPYSPRRRPLDRRRPSANPFRRQPPARPRQPSRAHASRYRPEPTRTAERPRRS